MKLNRRNQFLIGFGGIAVVLLVLFNMWYPPVNEEAATGAVGAVKKHRQQQIASQDVILGDESSRKQAKILYADYLEDAAKLQNASVELAMALRNADAQSVDLAAMEAPLSAAAKALAAQSSEIENRARLAAQSALESMESLLVELGPAIFGLDVREALEADLASVAKSIENRATLNSAEMEALSVQLGSVSNKLETHVLHAASALEVQSRLEAVGRELENMEADEASLGVVKTELEAIERLVGKSAALENASLEHAEAYLAAMARENKALESAGAALEAASRKLQAAHALENADLLSLEAAKRALANHALELENLAVVNLESQMELLTLENEAALSLDGALGLVSKTLENRSGQLSAAARQDLELGVQAADRALANRSEGLDTAMLASMELQLAAVGRFIENRAALNNSWAEASMLGKASSNLENFEGYLGKMSAQFENRSAKALEKQSTLESRRALKNQELEKDLGTRAKALQNRAKQLESASASGPV